MSKFYKAAKAYTELGWAVLPLHTIINGKCTCSKGLDCSSPGKHPRTLNGVKDATKEQELIKKWAEMWPDSNIGVATGEVSGIIAIDIDVKGNGKKALAELENELGKLPETLEQITGGNGTHLVYKYPGNRIDNKVRIAPGIDIRGDNGYIVVSPSIHSSGNEYEWNKHQSPRNMKAVELPEIWLEKLQGNDKKTNVSINLIDREIIPEGCRTDTLFKFASSLRSKGLTSDEIYSTIRILNESRCKPPLNSDEIIKIINSVEHYEAGRLPIKTVKTTQNELVAKVICLDDVEQKEVKWIWKPYIPQGKLILVQGNPGDGKTTFALHLASIISTGGHWSIDGKVHHISEGKVVYQTAEDGLADTINRDC